MDKDDGRIYISYKAQSQLFTLAEHFHKPMDTVLEWLIEDRFSVSDQRRNKERRDETMKEYLEQCPSGPLDRFTLEKIWRNGYHAGWVQFQTRHDEQGFIIEFKDP